VCCFPWDEILSPSFVCLSIRKRYGKDKVVVTKWLREQASSRLPKTLEVVKSIASSDFFDKNNPNSNYALFGGFASNFAVFHNVSEC
jgi:hypothetical protein